MISLSSCVPPVLSGTRLYRVRMVGAALAVLTLAASHAAATTYHAYVVPNPDGFITTYGTGVSSGTAVGYAFTSGGEVDAFRWDGSPASLVATNLNTPGSNSQALSISGGQIVGANTDLGAPHAILWVAGTPNDLHPAGAGISLAYSTNGTTQVGLVDGAVTAWTGSATGSVTLTPPAPLTGGTWDFSQPNAQPTPAIAANGTIVATATDINNGVTHAFLWNDSGSTATPLDPGGGLSKVYGADGSHQVGTAAFMSGGTEDPVLWTGTAGSAEVLPFSTVFYSSATATGIFGSSIIGWGVSTSLSPDLFPHHALLWENLSTGNPIDLPMPTGFASSEAISIDANGVIFGNVHPASDTNLSQAIIWVPDSVPEPATLGLLGLGVMGLLVRKRR